MENNLGFIFVIAISGGLIAYIGDKLGSKIGKKRMSLFGLRPYYTSIMVTVMTGILIAAGTIGVASLLSGNVRTALFGMEQLRAEMDSLNAKVNQRSMELEAGKKDLAQKVEDLAKINDQVQRTEAELEAAQLARDSMSGELQSVQTAYDSAQTNLQQAHGEIASLEDTRVKMTNHITNLEITSRQLEENIINLREGNVVFRIGEVLAGAVVKPGLKAVEVEAALAGILNDTNALILKRIGHTEATTMLYVNPDNIREISQLLAESKTPMLIRIITAGNVVNGEPAIAHIVAQPYMRIYTNGTLVWKETVTGGGNAQQVILSFLRDVNGEAKTRGVLPDPLTGEIGTMPGNELYNVIEQLGKYNGPVSLEAYATEDTYTSGPLGIRIRMVPIV